MAPEQLDGTGWGPGAHYTPWAPCFEAAHPAGATGRTPMEIVQDANGRPPPDLRDHLPHAPVAAADVLRRALDPDPDHRPRSARELASALVGALERPEPAVRTKRIAPRPRDRSHAWPGRARRGHRVGAGGPGSASWRWPPGRRRLGAGIRHDPQAASGARAEEPSRRAGEEEGAAPGPESQIPAPQPQAPPVAPVATGASGSQLNGRAQGFDLIKAGRYGEAVPVLRAAVTKWPEGSRDIDVATHSSIPAGSEPIGNPQAAIPFQRRLAFQRPAQHRAGPELDDARRAAGSPAARRRPRPPRAPSRSAAVPKGTASSVFAPARSYSARCSSSSA